MNVSFTHKIYFLLIYFAVTDFVSGGELFDLWSDHGPFNEGLTRIYIAELALAIGR